MKFARLEFRVTDEQFKISSYSDPGGIIKTCVALARTPEGVAVRHSTDPDKKTLFFSNDEWTAFTQGVRAGEFG
ncbi:MAG: DUF397 domain-containing protein [Patescibacteria group bacterium]